MPDSSHLDSKYFIDTYVYNCPFCKRGNVAYGILSKHMFHWTEEKECYVYRAICCSCKYISMHLSYESLGLHQTDRVIGRNHLREFHEDEVQDDLDSKFFYSVPTSFFALDNSIPEVLRSLVVEAQGCLKSNYLTGASACARKIIYELAIDQNATGDNYDERIKSLKSVCPNIEPAYFDTLLTVQQITSDKVHEDSYDGWENKHLRLLLSSLTEILSLIYVIPNVLVKKRQEILKLKEEILGKPAKRAKPAEPAKTAKTAKPAKPAKPAEPAKSAKPGDLVRVAEVKFRQPK